MSSRRLRFWSCRRTLAVKTFQELVAYGKANPGKLNFASAGIGTTPHLAGEMFKLRTGIDATHIPYKGIGASYTDMMSGKVQMAFSSIAGALPFTNDNRVRADRHHRGASAARVYPDLPTVAEAGLPGFEVDLWLGIFAPAGLPARRAGASSMAPVEQSAEESRPQGSVRQSRRRRHAAPAPRRARNSSSAEFDKWKKVIADGKIKR